MAFGCVICQEEFSSQTETQCINIDQDEGETGNHIVATKCGHLFHEACLLKWFKTKRETNELNHIEHTKNTCPFCTKDVVESELIKIYPVQLEGSDSTPRDSTSDPDLIKSLTCEMNRLTAIVASQRMVIEHGKKHGDCLDVESD